MNGKNNNASRYRTVPVDFETHAMILAICDAYEMGKRAQGALLRRLVKAEYRKMTKYRLLDEQIPSEVSQIPE